MGIIGSIFKHTVGKAIGHTVGYAAADVGIKACDAASKKLKETSEKKVDTFFDGAADGHSRLIVGQKPYTFKESFQIFDERENVKYVVKGKLVSATHDLTVYDASGKIKLGRVKEKLVSWRSPFSMEAHPQDFVIEMGGKKLGKMKSRFSFGKRKFKFTFNNWTLEGNIFGLKYKVLDGKEKVMEVSEKVWTIGDVYYLDITNPDNELLCILILLAIDSSHTLKSSDNKRTMRRKTRRLRHWI
ncbi:MAG: hypothetical protein IJV68_04895 [Clostridia bacterium]|nr:hypothetical protein [Clostridia bacterium]